MAAATPKRGKKPPHDWSILGSPCHVNKILKYQVSFLLYTLVVYKILTQI